MITAVEVACQVLLWLTNRFLVREIKIKRIFLILSTVALVFRAFRRGIDDFLHVSPLILLFCPAAAYFLYVVSLFIVGTKFERENLLPFECLRYRGGLFRLFRNESLRNIYSSTYEELLYRWFLVNATIELTKSIYISAFVSSVLFFAVHIIRKKPIVGHIDIFVFSVLITVFFTFTKNPIYCIMIHILRNQLVICQKFVFIKRENDRKIELLKIIKDRRQKSE